MQRFGYFLTCLTIELGAETREIINDVLDAMNWSMVFCPIFYYKILFGRNTLG